MKVGASGVNEKFRYLRRASSFAVRNLNLLKSPRAAFHLVRAHAHLFRFTLPKSEFLRALTRASGADVLEALRRAEETAVELVEPDKSEQSQPSRKAAVEEKRAIQTRPHRGKWGRRFLMATGALAILYLAWAYIWPLLR